MASQKEGVEINILQNVTIRNMQTGFFLQKYLLKSICQLKSGYVYSGSIGSTLLKKDCIT